LGAIMRFWWPAFEAYMMHKPEAEVARLVAQCVEQTRAIPDSEPPFYCAEAMAYCKQNRAALELLRTCVERGYCSVPAMDLDPMFAGLRGTPEFQKIRQAGIDCQQRFIAARDAMK